MISETINLFDLLGICLGALLFTPIIALVWILAFLKLRDLIYGADEGQKAKKEIKPRNSARKIIDLLMMIDSGIRKNDHSIDYLIGQVGELSAKDKKFPGEETDSYQERIRKHLGREEFN